MSEINAYLSKTTSLDKSMNVRKSDIISKELRITRRKIEKKYSELIADGYTKFTVPAGNNIDLSGQAPGKYVVVWDSINPPDGITYNITRALTLTGSGGTLHTDVVIICAKWDTFGRLIEHSKSNVFFNPGTSESYLDGSGNSILTIYGSKLYQSGGSDPAGITIEDSDIGITGNWDYPIIKNSNITFTNDVSITSNNTADFSIENVVAYRSNTGAAIDFELVNDHTTENTVTVKNFYLKNDNNEQLLLTGRAGVSNHIDFINCYIGYGYTITNITGDTNITLYAGTMIYPANYYVKPAYLDRQTFISNIVTEWKLDLDYIDTDSNYSDDLQVTVSPVFQNYRVAGGQYSRRYYNFNFRSAAIFLDQFKTVFAREQSILVWWRQDLETDTTFGIMQSGSEKKIKNLTLYDSDGSTLTDYRNNENFFILTQDSSSNYALFAWYEGRIYPTVFTDYWNVTSGGSVVTYTIVKIFHLLEAPESSTIQNLIHNLETNQAVGNSPLSGSVQFKDLTSVYIDKRL